MALSGRDAGAAAFGAAKGLPRLEHLDLRSNSIFDAGAEALAAGPGLPALETLGLLGNPIYVPGATEDWLDQGTWVGSGLVKSDASDLNARFGRRFKIE